MEWTKTDYPSQMKKLPEDIRNKAIEIANALMKSEEPNEKIAIPTAIKRAEDWAEKRDKDKKAKKEEDDKQPNVIPTENGWFAPKEIKVDKVKTYDEDAARLTQTKKSHPPVDAKDKSGRVEIHRQNQSHNK